MQKFRQLSKNNEKIAVINNEDKLKVVFKLTG